MTYKTTWAAITLRDVNFEHHEADRRARCHNYIFNPQSPLPSILLHGAEGRHENKTTPALIHVKDDNHDSGPHMAPFFSRRSRRKRASTLAWVDQTYSPRRDLHDTTHMFDQEVESYSSSSAAPNTEDMFDTTGRDSTVRDSPLDFVLLDSHKVNGLSRSAAGMASTTRMKRLAKLAFASAACLAILFSVEHILNTILILLLFAPYPPRLRHSRFILLIPLIGHESVRIKAKSEFVLIFSTVSAMSFLDWNSIKSNFSTTTPPQEAADFDVHANSVEVMRDMPASGVGVD